MRHGLVNGGPLDGTVIESDRDYWEAIDKEDLPLILAPLGQEICNKTYNTFIYKKINYQKNNYKWYEWIPEQR